MNLPFLLGGSPAVTGVTMPEVTNLLNDTTYPKATIDATTGALQVSLASKADKIASAQGWARSDSLYSDGATSNRCIYWPLAAVGSIAGQVVTLRIEGYVPTVNPSANVTLAGLCASSTTSPYDQNNACSVVLGTSGNLSIRQSGANYLNDRREFSWAGFRAAYSGRWIRGIVIFGSADTTTDPTVEIDTVDVTSNFTRAPAGAAPNWMPSTLVATYYVAGFNAPTGRFIPYLPILGTTTKTARDQWVTTGAGSDWWEVGTGTSNFIGTARALSVGASDGADTSGTGAASVTAQAGARSGGSGSYILRATGNGNFGITLPRVFPGQIVTVSFWARTNGSAATPGWRLTANTSLGSGTVATGTSGQPALTSGATWAQFSATFAPTETVNQLMFTAIGVVGTDYIEIDDLSIAVTGPIAKPGLQPGTYQVARDLGDNGVDGYLTTGITLTGDMKRRPQVRYKGVNIGTAAYLGAASDQLFAGWDVDCVQITNGGASSAVDVKVQLSDGTNHTDLFSIVTISAGSTALFYPTVGGFDTRRRLRAVATSGADNLTFNFSLRRRA